MASSGIEGPRSKPLLCLGFALVEILLAVVLLLALGAIAVREYRLTDTAADVARVRRDFRTVDTAIQSYYVDNRSYPASTNVGMTSIYARHAPKLQNCRTFRIRVGFTATLQTLTTPVAYMSSYPSDPFANTPGATYSYWSGRSGWILGSWGPDRDETNAGQLNWCGGTFHTVPRGSAVNPAFNPGVETVYDPVNEVQPSTILRAGGGPTGAYTYDPTNGAVSAGDLWHVKGQANPPLERGLGMVIH